ncbi:MAG: hypothetical protein KKD35_07230 [Elusimicrobia bacterium]|nr:hypothetical protein [Elusimicrobiota bacterium]
MRRLCAWCKKDMGSVDNGEDIMTHGICEECEKLVEFEPVKTRKLIDEFNKPVLMNESGRCLVANTAASKALEKEIDSIEGYLGGDVICCVHASEPGGCGATEHCSGCTIRNTVTDTLKTGKSHLKVQAYQFIQTKNGTEKKEFFVSTEKKGNRVLLRID